MELWSGFVDKTETVLDSLGMMSGEFAIPKRMAFGAILFGVVVSYLKPDLMYTRGVPRPWKVFDKEDKGAVPATWIPWWSASVLGAFLFGVLI